MTLKVVKTNHRQENEQHVGYNLQAMIRSGGLGVDYRRWLYNITFCYMGCNEVSKEWI